MAPAKHRKICFGKGDQAPFPGPCSIQGNVEGAKPEGHSDNNEQDNKMADCGSTAAMEEDGNTSGDVVVPDAAQSSNSVM